MLFWCYYCGTSLCKYNLRRVKWSIVTIYAVFIAYKQTYLLYKLYIDRCVFNYPFTYLVFSVYFNYVYMCICGEIKCSCIFFFYIPFTDGDWLLWCSQYLYYYYIILFPKWRWCMSNIQHKDNQKRKIVHLKLQSPSQHTSNKDILILFTLFYYFCFCACLLYAATPLGGLWMNIWLSFWIIWLIKTSDCLDGYS